MVTLNEATMAWCRRHHGAGILNRFTPTETFRLASEQAVTKMAECAAGIFLGMNGSLFADLDKCGPFEVLGPTGMRIDVKSSNNPKACRLIWPVEKTDEFTRRDFNSLMFAKTHCLPVVELVGWMSKEEFADKRTISDGSVIPTVGAWFVHQDLLHDVRELVPMIDLPLFLWANR